MWYPGIWDGRKWRQRGEMGGKISKTWAKYGVFALIKVKNGPNRAKKGLKRAEDRVVVAKNTFFCLDILFAEYLLSEEIILMKSA